MLLTAAARVERPIAVQCLAVEVVQMKPRLQACEPGTITAANASNRTASAISIHLSPAALGNTRGRSLAPSSGSS